MNGNVSEMLLEVEFVLVLNPLAILQRLVRDI